jgi:hypothetical protein
VTRAATRRERIITLLEHYQDVQPGLVDTFGGEGGALFTAGCWKHSSYRELERLRIQLRDQQPQPYWHLAEVYFRAGRRRIALCPHCERSGPPSAVGQFCNHGKPHAKTVTMVPRVVRVISDAVDDAIVGLAITWLDHNWRGDPSLPDDLRGKRAA